MKILSGNKIREEIIPDIQSEVLEIQKKHGKKLCLAIIQVGDDIASGVYIKNKVRFGEKIGVDCELVKFPIGTSQEVVLEKISELNKSEEITGIIVQLPLPENLDKNIIINSILSSKDVDGLGQINLAMLLNNEEDGIIPATARGIIQLLEKNNIKITGKNALVIGRSVLVGKSTTLALINKDATVTLAHSKTQNLQDLFKANDIIISAVGKPGLINDDFDLKGKVLVDVGISINDDIIVGDVALSDLKKKQLLAISPVPGGVGPMTVMSLFQNVIQAHYLQSE